MADLKFVFKLNRRMVDDPKARLWVDLNGDGKLLGHEEVNLEQKDLTWTWTGSTSAEPLSKVTFFLSYFAPIGAKWTLKVTSGEGDDEKVHINETDECEEQPSWIRGRLKNEKA